MADQHPFKWRHFQAGIILRCVRWYIRYPLSYRHLEEMMPERGLHIDHTTIYRSRSTLCSGTRKTVPTFSERNTRFAGHVDVLKTVYTRAGEELTDPQEGCKLRKIKSDSSGEQPMLRSQTVLTIHDLHLQGKSVQEIAQELKISRTTVRKYLQHPEAVLPKPRAPRPSKLDPFKEQITTWVTQDHCTNCEVIFARLKPMGYTGGISILKEFVHPLRPVAAGHAPVVRYESQPGEQVQFDWVRRVARYSIPGTTRKNWRNVLF